MADLKQILKLRVPLSVTLAQRKMPLGQVLKLTPGAVIEFQKSVDDALELTVNNKAIASGVVVKAGERMGLRLTRVGKSRELVESLK